MRVLSWEDFVGQKGFARPIAATVGVFDGLHIGHRRLIEKVFSHGLKRLSCVFTFQENPKRYLSPETFKGSLFSLDQKLEMLEALGLDLCVLIDFSGNFGKLAGRDFLSLLEEKGRLEYMVVGSNFSCGYKLDTNARDIADFYSSRGVLADVFEPVLWDGQPVSSSRIRAAIIEGKLEDAAAMLGRGYELDLGSLAPLESDSDRVVYARPPDFVLPPEGTYEAEAKGKGSRRQLRLAIHADRLELFLSGKADATRVELMRLTKETKR
jgi:cytidyltransferase-like protein